MISYFIFFHSFLYIVFMISNSPLPNISQCSMASIFQEMFSKSFKSYKSIKDNHHNEEEGSDFKRLIQKHKKLSSSSSSSSSQSLIKVEHKKGEYHQDSPDFRPIVYLNNTTSQQRTTFVSSLYNYFFQHEDRYFNHDREELSKDIFPTGHKQTY
ncbi:uncharacterized protein BX663DRAFT_511217 [Cokeromyces recurvatus]|uniref:uncharacterized protein n=1 Tax=Cokeromyces recurvatus TaxID=90255 RepID=UPI002220095F|nr:uncharacterized protein BX663DRAFT_511217 [Cokeromyces recurvatus]KAI7902487.1 hypothetical protein BX663DRAFT_511217 [Cokeromyces recurvatus]